MMDIAEHDGGEEFVKANQISARQGISAKYLEQIIAILNKAGYVNSVRGAQGGYKLAQSAENYTVGMILRLTEGSLFPVACMDEEVNSCSRCNSCEPLEVWKQISDAINNVVDNVTIADLLQKKTERENSK
jgi:Rrf2 family protein